MFWWAIFLGNGMNNDGGTVMRIVVHAKGRQGDRFAIVQLNDGRLGITQNEQLLQTVRFDTAEMEQCVREFIRRTGIAPDEE